MPLTARSGQYVIVTIGVPFGVGGDLRVSSNGIELERVDNNLGRERNLTDQGLGFFAVDNVDPNPTPAEWRLRVSPIAIQQCALEAFTLSIRHVVAGTESAPLTIGFTVPASESFRVLGVSGRAVALEWPPCSAIQEFKLERQTGGAGGFSEIARVPSTAGVYRDTSGLPTGIQADYRLTFVKQTGPGSSVEVGSTPAISATTAALSGSVDVALSNPDRMQDPHRWRGFTSDPLKNPPFLTLALAQNAVLTRVQNDGSRDIFVTFTDTQGAKVTSVQIPAGSSVTAPFIGMRAGGNWDPVRTTGSAVGLPNVWPMKIFWREP